MSSSSPRLFPDLIVFQKAFEFSNGLFSFYSLNFSPGCFADQTVGISAFGTVGLFSRRISLTFIRQFCIQVYIHLHTLCVCLVLWDGHFCLFCTGDCTAMDCTECQWCQPVNQTGGILHQWRGLLIVSTNILTIIVVTVTLCVLD